MANAPMTTAHDSDFIDEATGAAPAWADCEAFGEAVLDHEPADPMLDVDGESCGTPGRGGPLAGPVAVGCPGSETIPALEVTVWTLVQSGLAGAWI